MKSNDSSLRGSQKTNPLKHNTDKESGESMYSLMKFNKNFNCGINVNEPSGSKEYSLQDNYSSTGFYNKPPTHGKESSRNTSRSNLKNSRKSQNPNNKIMNYNKSQSIGDDLANNKEHSIGGDSIGYNKAFSIGDKSVSEGSGSGHNKYPGSDKEEKKKSKQDERNDRLNQKYMIKDDELLYNIIEEEHDNNPNLSSKMELYDQSGISKKIDYLGSISRAFSFSPNSRINSDNPSCYSISDHDENSRRILPLDYSKMDPDDNQRRNSITSKKVYDPEMKQYSNVSGFSKMSNFDIIGNSDKSIKSHNSLYIDILRNSSKNIALKKKNTVQDVAVGNNNNHSDLFAQATLKKSGYKRRQCYNLGIIKEEQPSAGIEDSGILLSKDPQISDNARPSRGTRKNTHTFGNQLGLPEEPHCKYFF